MIKVILDTNALMMPFEVNINLERELDRLLGAYEILVLSSVIDELKKLSEKDKAASSALKLAERYAVINTSKKGDFSVVHLAKELKAVVVTNDKILRKILRNEGIPLIFLRGKDHLIYEGKFR
jgi:rRNA-processing protein FCF1